MDNVMHTLIPARPTLSPAIFEKSEYAALSGQRKSTRSSGLPSRSVEFIEIPLGRENDIVTDFISFGPPLTASSVLRREPQVRLLGLTGVRIHTFDLRRLRGASLNQATAIIRRDPGAEVSRGGGHPRSAYKSSISCGTPTGPPRTQNTRRPAAHRSSACTRSWRAALCTKAA